MPALLSNYQQAIVTLLSNYQQVTVPKGAIVACTGLRSDIHLRERPHNNIRPCHCAGIFKQYDPALLDQNQTARLLAGHTLLTKLLTIVPLKPDRFMPNSAQIQVWVLT